jgi:hypothetical protein
MASMSSTKSEVSTLPTPNFSRTIFSPKGISFLSGICPKQLKRIKKIIGP